MFVKTMAYTGRVIATLAERKLSEWNSLIV
jgi:hypothetical protein